MVKTQLLAWSASALALYVSCWANETLAQSTQERPANSDEQIQKREPTRFLRVLKDEFDNPVSLQTATARYVLKDEDGEVKLEVILEGVIHIADSAYYQSFNQRFRHYDAVLYELVAPPEKRVPDPEEQEGINPLRLVQQLAADGLGFSHQVNEIDYKAENLVHSDLSPAEMAAAMRNRGDDQLTVLSDIMLHMMRQANRDLAAARDNPKPPPSLDLSVLSDPQGAVKLRRLMAKSIGEIGSLEAALPPSQVASLIGDRNERAMKVLQQQLDQGKRRVAFFWGAGHMADFEKRLILAYGLEPAGVTWRNAWDLREGAVRHAPLESILEKTLRGTLEDAVRELLKRPKDDQ